MYRGTWLAPSEHTTLDLGVMSMSPMLGLLKKKMNFKKKKKKNLMCIQRKGGPCHLAWGAPCVCTSEACDWSSPMAS